MVASLKGQLLNRWLGVRLDFSGICLVTAVCLASTLSAGSLDPGLVGLMLSYALTVTGMINFTARFFSDTESQLSSVERMHFYSKVLTLTSFSYALAFLSRLPPHCETFANLSFILDCC